MKDLMDFQRLSHIEVRTVDTIVEITVQIMILTSTFRIQCRIYPMSWNGGYITVE